MARSSRYGELLQMCLRELPWGARSMNLGDLLLLRMVQSFVADTFNFRIQKFHGGWYLREDVGLLGQAEKTEAFYGPRGLAFDSSGRLVCGRYR